MIEQFEYDFPNFSTGIPKSKSHFSKLKKAYNETTSKVSTVVQQGLRGADSQRNSGVAVLSEYMAHKDAILDVTAVPGRANLFASCSMDKTAKVWNWRDGTLLTKYTGHRGAVNSVALHPIKQLAITGSGDAECHLWPFCSETEEPALPQAPILTYGSHSAVVTR